MAKKKRKPYYLKMYSECIITGRLPDDICGLCEIFGLLDRKLLMFQPLDEDCSDREIWQQPDYYWGAETREEYMQNLFGPLRQTIVLFMAAMNNEL